MINFTHRNIGIFYSSLAERDRIFDYISKQLDVEYLRMEKSIYSIRIIFPNIIIHFLPITDSARGYIFDEAYVTEFTIQNKNILIAELAVAHTNGTLYVMKEWYDGSFSRVNYYDYEKKEKEL